MKITRLNRIARVTGYAYKAKLHNFHSMGGPIVNMISGSRTVTFRLIT